MLRGCGFLRWWPSSVTGGRGGAHERQDGRAGRSQASRMRDVCRLYRQLDSLESCQPIPIPLIDQPSPCLPNPPSSSSLSPSWRSRPLSPCPWSSETTTRRTCALPLLRPSSLTLANQSFQLQERRTGQVRSRRRAEEQAQPAAAARRPRSKTMRHQGPRRYARRFAQHQPGVQGLQQWWNGSVRIRHQLVCSSQLIS